MRYAAIEQLLFNTGYWKISTDTSTDLPHVVTTAKWNKMLTELLKKYPEYYISEQMIREYITKNG